MAELTTYAYQVIDDRGRKKKGKLPAESHRAAIAALQAEGYIPVVVEPFRQGVGNFDVIRSKEDRPIKLKSQQVVTMARQLYLLVRAGLSIPKTLEVIGEDNDDIRYVRMCNDLADKVLAGVPLSRAMERYPGAFDEVFRAYVGAGEETGNLEEALYRLSRMLEKGNQLRLKIKGVTAYPKLVSVMITVMVVGIMLFLVPMYADIYANFGAELPAPTRALMFLSELMVPVRFSLNGLALPPVSLADTGFFFSLSPPFVVETGGNLLSSPINFFSPIVWAAAGFVGFRKYRKHRADDLTFGMKLDKLKFRMPVLGKMLMYQTLYRWSATMAGALSSGLQLHDTLGLAARASGSQWMQLITKDFQDAVRAGRPLSRELAKYPGLFSPQIRAMATTGEESGEPAEMFASVAASLEDELDAMVAVIGARIEVVLLVIMGFVVGSLLIVLYLPILNLSSVASEGYQQDANPTIPSP
jgi:type IV pilus assembly protein PilC